MKTQTKSGMRDWMKFTDGYWLTRPEYSIQIPKQCYDYKENADGSLDVFLPYKQINSRSDILNLGMTTMHVVSPREDVIRVKLTHHDVDEDAGFSLTEYPSKSIVSNTEGQLIFQSGQLRLEINKRPFSMNYVANDECLTSSFPGSQGYIVHENGKVYMREQLSLQIDELVYGLGERFTPFVKNGQVVDIWNQDGGTGSEQSYKNIPFYLTNKGYGVFVNNKGKVSYEISSENVARTQFSVEGEELEYLVIYGPTTKEILQKYTDLTGKPALPPAWSFGLWLSTSFTTDYSEETVLEFIDGMLERDIPFDVFHFDCFWMKEFEWCSFAWDKDKFPDPEGLIKKIHDRGLKVCLWINPYIGQKSPLFNEGKEAGYLIKRENGKVWQWDLWQAGNGIVDFTNPEAVEWYTGYLEKLLDMGVDSFKTDFGERIPTDGVYYDQANPILMHNYYSYLYNQVVFDLLEKKKGKDNAVVFARSGTVGSQKFPVHWGGDNLSEYTSMAETLRGGLSFLLSGFGFWSHDIGGFEENTSPDLYKRWTQFGFLSSHSRYHGNIEYRVPWNFGDEAVEVTRKFSKLKNSLMPYLFTQATETAKTGIPMMRPLFMEYEEDRNAGYLDQQYLLGESLLVAPIFSESGNVQYYLPKGTWTHLLSGKVYDIQVGDWMNETYDYFSLPLFVKENTILVTSKQEQNAAYNYLENPVISIYQMSVSELTQTVGNADNRSQAQIKVIKEDNIYEILVTGFVGTVCIRLFSGQTVTEEEVSLSSTEEIIKIKL
jgi:alpha-D-xyloside xylohydrolase